MTERFAQSLEAQVIGRAFTYQGSLHFVLDASARTGMARCSRRADEGPGMTWLPMTEVHRILCTEDDALREEAVAGGAPTPRRPALRVAD